MTKGTSEKIDFRCQSRFSEVPKFIKVPPGRVLPRIRLNSGKTEFFPFRGNFNLSNNNIVLVDRMDVGYHAALSLARAEMADKPQKAEATAREVKAYLMAYPGNKSSQGFMVLYELCDEIIKRMDLKSAVILNGAGKKNDGDSELIKN